MINRHDRQISEWACLKHSVCMCAKALQSCPALFGSKILCPGDPGQDPLSMRFPRQEYWNGLPFPSPGDLPDPGVKPASLNISCTGKQVLYY